MTDFAKFAYADLTNEKLRRDLGGSDFTLPKLSKSLRLALRFSQQIAGTHVEVFPVIRELRATIGQVDLRPDYGTISFKVGTDTPVTGTNVTDLLVYPFTAAQLQTALNALSVVGTAVVVEDSESFLVTGVPAAITTYENTLRPISFGRVTTSTINGATQHEIRLQRAPFAFTDQFAQKVPAGPTIERVQAGGEVDGVTWNEIQKLTTPRNFAGSYQIRRDDEIQRTALLGIGDGPDEVALAMNPDDSLDSLGVAEDSDGEFLVTEHPTEPAMFIEFAGSMAGAAQDLLKISVFDAPAGDFHIALTVDTAATAEIWRSVDEISAPFEIFADIEDADDEDLVYLNVPVYRGTINLVESITHDDLGTAANQNYLEPPSAKKYQAVSPDSLTSGVRFYPFLIGDGVAGPSFAIAHNLASPRCNVSLRENASAGKELVPGTDYNVHYGSDNQCTITLAGTYAVDPPDTDALTGTVQDLTVTSTWLAHTHTIAEVTGLQTILDAYGAAIAALQALAPTSPLTRNTSLTGAQPSFPLGSVWIVPRARVKPPKPDTLLDWSVSANELGEKPRNLLRLLPAVHDASLETLPAAPLPVPSTDYAGRVFTASTDRTDFPGGGLLAGDTAACDGREWYRVNRIGSESTYYPVDFDKLLFEVAINASEFPTGSRIDLDFGFEVIALMLEEKERTRRTMGSWVFLLEVGTSTAATTPGTPGANLAIGFSAAVTLIEERITLTSGPRPHTFGASITRSSAGTLSAVARKYGREYAATAPGAADLVFRARFHRFDTEDAPTDARGIVALRGLDVGLDGQPDNSLGVLTITK